MAIIHVCPLCRAQVTIHGPGDRPNETVYDGSHSIESCIVTLRDRIEWLEESRRRGRR